MTSSSNSKRRRNRQASQDRSAEMNGGMPATIRPGKINRQAFPTLSEFLAGTGGKGSLVVEGHANDFVAYARMK